MIRIQILVKHTSERWASLCTHSIFSLWRTIPNLWRSRDTTACYVSIFSWFWWRTTVNNTHSAFERILFLIENVLVARYSVATCYLSSLSGYLVSGGIKVPPSDHQASILALSHFSLTALVHLNLIRLVWPLPTTYAHLKSALCGSLIQLIIWSAALYELSSEHYPKRQDLLEPEPRSAYRLSWRYSKCQNLEGHRCMFAFFLILHAHWCYIHVV